MLGLCNWKGATQVMHSHLQHVSIMIAVAKAIVFFIIFDSAIKIMKKYTPENSNLANYGCSNEHHNQNRIQL